MRCPYCGKENAGRFFRCVYCNTLIHWTDENLPSANYTIQCDAPVALPAEPPQVSYSVSHSVQSDYELDEQAELSTGEIALITAIIMLSVLFLIIVGALFVAPLFDTPSPFWI